jgi:signal transduction histidine kinase/ligand-binding sensor domain-containing protein
MRIALCLIGIIFCSRSWSMEASLALRPLNHRSWTAVDGAPNEVRTMTQTADGMLWVAGQTGLFRFDGVHFARYTGSAGEPFQSNNISALAAWPDSGLWMGFRFGGVGVLQNGRLAHYDERDGLPQGTIRNILKDSNGTIWVLARGGFARLQGSHWEKVPLESDDAVSTSRAAFIDPQGTFWIMMSDSLLMKTAHDSRFQKLPLREGSVTDMPLAAAPDGAIWMSISHAGLARMNASTDLRAGHTVVVPGMDPSTLLFDREGNLWSGSTEVRRLPARLLSSRSIQARPHFEVVASSNDLTGVVLSLFEDREGNIWVGTTAGLDRFSHSNIMIVPLPPDAESPALVAADAGAIWAAYTQWNGTGGITLIRRDAQASPLYLEKGNFSCAYRDPDGSVWFGGPSGLLHIEGNHHSLTPLPDSGRKDVQALVRDRAGAMWVSMSPAGGLFRLSKGRWSAYGDLPELPRLPAMVASSDASGALWFGYTGSRIARVEGTSVRLFGPKDGLNLGNITAIHARGRELWIAGELGLARFDGERFSEIRGVADDALIGISGLVATANGDLWANGYAGITHIRRSELEHARSDKRYRVQYETFNHLDGLPGTAVQIRPAPSLIEGSDGRLWFAQNLGHVGWIDPAHIQRNPLPPPVSILSVSSAGKRYPIAPDTLHLPIGTTSLHIQYAAGSLSIPERVRFRYQLVGSDSDWQDAGNRREAFYTNLAPGPYTFRVVAANNDGLWNNTGTSLALFISPAFYQTKWFYAACLVMFFALLHTLHRVRLKTVRAEALGRLEARLAERERIARELHDTLLQSIQGLILRFHAVTERIPPREPARRQMESALERAEEVLNEGRHRVKNLRASEDGALNFHQALEAAGKQLTQEHDARFQASVEGAHRDLHPIVQEEAFLIAREALTNAFRHAKARTIEAQILYDAAEMRLCIRDDGIGIDAAILNRGRPGHWGLLGMRERATKIQAYLSISSDPNSGTEVKLRIPADVAYKAQHESSRRTAQYEHD